MKWRPDYLAEQCLERMDIKWQLGVISASSIDKAASIANCARARSIDAATSDNYRIAMARDEIFPRICVVKRGSKYVIAGGNHRHDAAIKNGESQFDAMIVDEIDQHTFNILCKSLNSRTGLQVSSELRLEQAAELVEKYNVPAKQAALQLNVHVDAIYKYLRAQDVLSLADSEGLQCEWDQTQSAELGTIKSRPVKVLVLKQTGGRKVDVKSVLDLKRRLAGIQTEKEMVETAQAWCKEINQNATAAKSRLLRPRRTMIVKAVSQFCNSFDKVESIEQSQMTIEELNEVKEKCLNTIRKISSIVASGSKGLR